MTKSPKTSPQHVILEIQPPLIKMFQPLQYKNPLNANHSAKQCFRSFHRLSFEKDQASKNLIQTQKTICHLKQIKTLTRLDIEIGLFSSCTHKALKRLAQSFKHLKNLSVLHFHAISIPNTSFGPKAATLCQALAHDLPRVQVKLTLSPKEANEDCTLMLQSFTNLENLTSVQLNFLQFIDFSKIEECIKILKSSRSISNLSVTLSDCTIPPFANLFADLKSIKSLQNAKVHFKSCAILTKRGLQEILPALKKSYPYRLQSLVIVFDGCMNQITPIDWWLFVSSMRRLRTPYKIIPKFIGSTQGGSALMGLICFLLSCFILIGVPILAIQLSGKSQIGNP